MQDKAPPLIRVIRRRSGAECYRVALWLDRSCSPSRSAASVVFVLDYIEGVGVGLLAGAGAPRAPRAARPFSVFLFPLFCAPLVMVHISPRGGS